MQQRTTHDLREDQRRQHIGPAVKELREREGWSLRDLGSRCGVSSAYLSRIERGTSIPSFAILASIATALNVTPEYFIQFERSAKELESELAHTLQQLGVPRSTWHEFAELSMESQEAIVNAFKQMTVPQGSFETNYHDAETQIFANGVDAAIDQMHEVARRDGFSPIDFSRHRTQLEECNSDRFAMYDKLCTLPAPSIFDPPKVLKGKFGVPSESPLLWKWWSRAQRSALLKVLDGKTSRVIYPRAAISNYIRSGKWGEHVQFDAETVRNHVGKTVKLLRSRSNYQIGLTDDKVPMQMLGKVNSGVLFSTPDGAASGDTGMALRFQAPETTARFKKWFDECWESLPEDSRSNDVVADWLASELAAEFSG